ncbi:uncharacterized protein LOC120349443 [Nilaparvata lugens]|uniref:uncharacterized protein LOC120349443 n=1 Tax=Nilaparvata lugens TaxID=108931 RepID=UPI00193E1D35|nr:uncharacterized protein LOC120349443 [Nilaparvata lugens]
MCSSSPVQVNPDYLTVLPPTRTRRPLLQSTVNPPYPNETPLKNYTLRQANDKPKWFKQTLVTMMIRANVDSEMKPYGIYTLNYVSFKDLMKATFSFGNVFYSKKQASQT